MGSVSKLFGRLDSLNVRYSVSKSFEFPNSELAASTFWSLTVLRNICAHHGRIWNRIPQFPPPVLKSLRVDSRQSIYGRTPWAWIVTLANLVDQVNGTKDFSKSVFGYIDEFPEFLEGLQRPQVR